MENLVLVRCDDAYGMTATLRVSYNANLDLVEFDIEPQCPINNHIRLFPTDVDALVEYLGTIRSSRKYGTDNRV